MDVFGLQSLRGHSRSILERSLVQSEKDQCYRLDVTRLLEAVESLENRTLSELKAAGVYHNIVK